MMKQEQTTHTDRQTETTVCTLESLPSTSSLSSPSLSLMLIRYLFSTMLCDERSSGGSPSFTAAAAGDRVGLSESLGGDGVGLCELVVLLGSSLASVLTGFCDWPVDSRAMGSLACTVDDMLTLASLPTAAAADSDMEDDDEGRVMTLGWDSSCRQHTTPDNSRQSANTNSIHISQLTYSSS